MSFNFVAAVTVHSDFGIQENKIYFLIIRYRLTLRSPLLLPPQSPAAQFESINSLALSLLHGPTLTSLEDYWKNHSLDYMSFVHKVMSLLFNTLYKFVMRLPS